MEKEIKRTLKSIIDRANELGLKTFTKTDGAVEDMLINLDNAKLDLENIEDNIIQGLYDMNDETIKCIYENIEKTCEQISDLFCFLESFTRGGRY